MKKMIKATDEIRYDICDCCGKLDYCYFDYDPHLGDGTCRCKECCIDIYDTALDCYKQQARIWKTMIEAIEQEEE